MNALFPAACKMKVKLGSHSCHLHPVHAVGTISIMPYLYLFTLGASTKLAYPYKEALLFVALKASDLGTSVPDVQMFSGTPSVESGDEIPKSNNPKWASLRSRNLKVFKKLVKKPLFASYGATGVVQEYAWVAFVLGKPRSYNKPVPFAYLPVAGFERVDFKRAYAWMGAVCKFWAQNHSEIELPNNPYKHPRAILKTQVLSCGEPSVNSATPVLPSLAHLADLYPAAANTIEFLGQGPAAQEEPEKPEKEEAPVMDVVIPSERMGYKLQIIKGPDQGSNDFFAGYALLHLASHRILTFTSVAKTWAMRNSRLLQPEQATALSRLTASQHVWCVMQWSPDLKYATGKPLAWTGDAFIDEYEDEGRGWALYIPDQLNSEGLNDWIGCISETWHRRLHNGPGSMKTPTSKVEIEALSAKTSVRDFERMLPSLDQAWADFVTEVTGNPEKPSGVIRIKEPTGDPKPKMPATHATELEASEEYLALERELVALRALLPSDFVLSLLEAPGRGGASYGKVYVGCKNSHMTGEVRETSPGSWEYVCLPGRYKGREFKSCTDAVAQFIHTYYGLLDLSQIPGEDWLLKVINLQLVKGQFPPEVVIRTVPKAEVIRTEHMRGSFAVTLCQRESNKLLAEIYRRPTDGQWTSLNVEANRHSRGYDTFAHALDDCVRTLRLQAVQPPQAKAMKRPGSLQEAIDTTVGMLPSGYSMQESNIRSLRRYLADVPPVGITVFNKSKRVGAIWKVEGTKSRWGYLHIEANKKSVSVDSPRDAMTRLLTAERSVKATKA